MRKTSNTKDGYELIEQEFKSRSDFIDFLKNAPTSSTFKFEDLASQKEDKITEEFTHTKSFKEALDLFENGWFVSFDEFLECKKSIDKIFPYIATKKSSANDIHGSRPNVPNYLMGLPNSMKRNVIQDKGKTIEIWFNSGYSCIMSTKEVFLSGVTMLSLMDFLESAGFRISLNTFEFARCGNQILYNKVCLKNEGEKTSSQKMFFPFCNPSYLRRLLFRITECTEGLTSQWTKGYGRVASNCEMRKLLEIKQNALLAGVIENFLRTSSSVEYAKGYITNLELDKYFQVNESIMTLVDDHNILKKTLKK